MCEASRRRDPTWDKGTSALRLRERVHHASCSGESFNPGPSVFGDLNQLQLMCAYILTHMNAQAHI